MPHHTALLAITTVALCVASCATEAPVPDPSPAEVTHDERPTDGAVKTEPIDGPPVVTGINMDRVVGRQPKDPRAPAVDPIQVTIFNRVLVKPKSADLTEADLKALAEDAAGHKVERLRKTAVSFYLVVFEATTPPRTAEQQQALIAALKATGAFEVVEGDQLMTIK